MIVDTTIAAALDLPPVIWTSQYAVLVIISIIVSHQLQLLNSILMYIIVNTVLFKSAACTGSFDQLPCGSCAKYFFPQCF